MDNEFYFDITDNNGNLVHLAPMIEEMKWSENDLDSPDAGRTLNGKMHRGKVTSKRKAEIKLLPQKTSVVNNIFVILRLEYFEGRTNMIPGAGALVMEMYNSTRSGGIMIVSEDKQNNRYVVHKEVSFNVIER